MGRTLKQRIRTTIKEHYGGQLSMFREEVSYREGTESFVHALWCVLSGRVSEQDEWRRDITKFSRTGRIDKLVGRYLRSIRLRHRLTLEDVAQKMKVHPTFVDEIEKGIIAVACTNIFNILRCTKATDTEWERVWSETDTEETLEEQIIAVIELYYGRCLWQFHPEATYEQSIAPFVHSLVRLIYPDYKPAPFGYRYVIVEGERQLLQDPLHTFQVQEAFAAVAK